MYRQCSGLCFQARPTAVSRQRCVRAYALDLTKRVSVPKDNKKKDALAVTVNENLKLSSIVLTGTDNTLLEATCKLLAQRLVYFPVYCRKYIEGTRKVSSLEEAVSKHGWDAIREEEGIMLRGITDQLKCITATLANGATVDAAIYPALLSSYIIHIEDASSPLPPDMDPQVASLLPSRAEICIRLAAPPSKGFKQEGYHSVAEKARACTDMAIQQLHAALKQHPGLADRKVEYSQGGLRGQPPMLRTLSVDVLTCVEAHVAAMEALPPLEDRVEAAA